MLEPVTVFTSVVGTRDTLLDDQNTEGAKFVAFVETIKGSRTWEERLAYNKFLSARRNARIIKILSHQYIDSRYSIWIDGRISLKVPACKLIDEWLENHDLAIFSHPKRNCIYEEANECASRQLDDPALIGEQVEKYRSEGFDEHKGLAESCVILRRNSDRMERFNNDWWSELCRFSVRDQISFMYAAHKSSLMVNLIQGNVCKHPYFSVKPRSAEAEPQIGKALSQARFRAESSF